MIKGFTLRTHGAFTYLVSPLLAEAGVRHCFTTRLGGVSKGHLASLNLGLGRGDSEEALRENYRIVTEALGFTGENLCLTQQVHEKKTAKIETPVRRSEGCDALMTDRAGIPLMSYSADCVPILLYDPAHHACASIHSGWRGTVKKIAAATIADMKEAYGTDPDGVLAAIGPSIGPCCFQIGADVAEEFLSAFPDETLLSPDGDGEHYHADLWRAVAGTLRREGVRDEHISLAGECTACHTDRYFSCRAGHGRFGAMGAFIEL